MKSRDYISLGIYTVLFLVVTMMVIFASAMSVFAYPFGIALAAIPGAIIYFLMRLKVPKKGSVLLSGLVIGAIEFLIGAGWPVALGICVGAILAEIITSAGDYKKFWQTSIGYGLFMTSFAIGTYGPIVYMKEFIEKQKTSNSLNQEFMNSLEKFLDPKLLVLIVGVTFLLSVIGCFFAKKVLNKKLKKAGII